MLSTSEITSNILVTAELLSSEIFSNATFNLLCSSANIRFRRAISVSDFENFAKPLNEIQIKKIPNGNRKIIAEMGNRTINLHSQGTVLNKSLAK